MQGYGKIRHMEHDPEKNWRKIIQISSRELIAETESMAFERMLSPQPGAKLRQLLRDLTLIRANYREQAPIIHISHDREGD